jgi:UDP-N-acetylglucosamine acyltransferase
MIDSFARVHPDAQIGENVTIEAFAYVAGDVVIGDGSWIGPGAVIMDGARIGRNCQVHTGAVISATPQDLKFRGEITTCEIGDNNTIREAVTISRGTAARGKTVIGDNNLIMTTAHVGHDCVIGSNNVLVNATLLAGEVEIGDWVILGGRTAVHQFCRIGSHAMTGGGSLVAKDIPPYVKAAHQPPSFVGANFIGLRRRGFTPDKIHEIQDIFRILFQSGYAYSKALDLIEEQCPATPEREEIVNFVRTSKRGILKPYNPNKKDEEED